MTRLGLRDFPGSLKRHICKEMVNSFYLFGHPMVKDAAGEDDDDNTCINPTLLDPNTNSWMMKDQLCPFSSYLPLELDKLVRKRGRPSLSEGDAQGGIVVNHCRKKLKELIKAFQQGKTGVTFVFHLGDPLELCYADGLSSMFDVVDCSGGLADQFGLANVLNAAETRLSVEPESILLTDTVQWHTLNSSSVVSYVEEALCAPLSILPSMYGLRLINRIQQEPPVYDPDAMMITWRRTPRYENLRVDLMTSLKRYLKDLARKCFLMDGYPPGEQSGMKHYTPSTLIYVLRSAAERLGCGFEDLRGSFMPPDLYVHNFQLALKTSHFWTWISKFACLIDRTDFNQEQLSRIRNHMAQFPTLCLVSAVVPQPDFVHPPHMPPVLCLLLLPTADLLADTGSISQFENAHHLDLFSIQTNPERMLVVSFVLVSNHGLEETHVNTFTFILLKLQNT